MHKQNGDARWTAKTICKTQMPTMMLHMRWLPEQRDWSRNSPLSLKEATGIGDGVFHRAFVRRWTCYSFKVCHWVIDGRKSKSRNESWWMDSPRNDCPSNSVNDCVVVALRTGSSILPRLHQFWRVGNSTGRVQKDGSVTLAVLS